MRTGEVIDILLVDDNPDDTELTTHALLESNKSLHLLHLKNGMEVLDLISDKMANQNDAMLNELKLVLMDLKLPKMDGLEILRKIRENKKTRNLPVVILTSSRERRDITEAYALGVNSYVVKPVGFDNYVRMVGALAFYWSEVNVQPNFRT